MKKLTQKINAIGVRRMVNHYGEGEFNLVTN